MYEVCLRCRLARYSKIRRADLSPCKISTRHSRWDEKMREYFQKPSVHLPAVQTALLPQMPFRRMLLLPSLADIHRFRSRQYPQVLVVPTPSAQVTRVAPIAMYKQCVILYGVRVYRISGYRLLCPPVISIGGRVNPLYRNHVLFRRPVSLMTLGLKYCISDDMLLPFTCGDVNSLVCSSTHCIFRWSAK